ncbi:MAG TPA: DEAD/DEAH box helicase [Acidimicrobiia bacterium]|nr:DEAD/DEAH box helicase [Acidimicrobiia bacterium]
MSALRYVDGLPFPADRFQIDAARAIDRSASVVVTAPTGSGKTVVAEAAIARALERGERAVYTTPLKALSNQKFGDFRESHGDAAVGLLTGDNSIKGSAPIVVMTTEVLRNMMYAGSPDLEDVGVVILDEVHYLQDPARGGVWEEIIVHLDRRIPLVCLSATVANADEFAAWVRERRGDTELVVETERPVPLESTYLIRDRWEKGSLRLFPIFQGNRPNERVAKTLRGPQAARRYASPRRHETCELLRRRRLLPAIYFIFSRAGCDSAASGVVARGLRLTSSEEAAEIRSVAEANTSHLRPEDLGVLGYDRWLHALEAGIASHHAGLVPAMKETVEYLFARGRVRLVFATETLALGINMPARTVVLENLSKFTGETHELLQPGDYTQLTGRAGRRGIDEAGTAVVLHSPYVPFDRAAGIAARGSHPLRSSFRPTYNMTVNLVARYERDRAEELLGSSFAQFREGRHRAELAEEIEADERRLAELRPQAEHPDVDIWAIVDEGPVSRDRALTEFAATTSPGDVLEWEDRGATVRHAVVSRGTGKRPRLLTVSEEGQIRRIASGRLPETVARLGRIDLPRPFRPRDAGYRRQVAAAIDAFDPTERVLVLEAAAEADPALQRHIEAARTARRVESRLEARRRQAGALGPGLVGEFRALLGLLESRGYVRGWSLTDKGERLRRVYNEMDLVLAEALDRGLFDGLDGAETAALASAFTYEPRRTETVGGWPPGIENRAARVEELWGEIAAMERSAGLQQTRPPDAGFAGLALRWVDGEGLAELFEDEEAPVGDFVRNCRQLIDLLRQIEDVAEDAPRGVREALRGLDRGVVAAQGAL